MKLGDNSSTNAPLLAAGVLKAVIETAFSFGRTTKPVVAASLLWLAPQAIGQECEIDYEVKNSSRYVYGPVNEECGDGEPHSVPFGNWGVDTESSDRKDGNQFQGWCKYRYLCDNNDDCSTHCQDPWYQWHSCTTQLPRYSPPNEDFFNYSNNTQQRSTRGTNSHGGGFVSVGVSCPVDTDGDNYVDEGGCLDLVSQGFGISGHRMELYELDGWIVHNPIFNDDDHVTTLRFPKLTATVSSTQCDVQECSAGSTGTYRSSTTSSSRTASARAAVRIMRARFTDEYNDCCDASDSETCVF